MLLIGRGRFSKVFQAVLNYTVDLFVSFSCIPFRVMGKVLEPIAAADGRRQATPPTDLPANCNTV